VSIEGSHTPSTKASPSSQSANASSGARIESLRLLTWPRAEVGKRFALCPIFGSETDIDQLVSTNLNLCVRAVIEQAALAVP
jgi:hypothetical protein